MDMYAEIATFRNWMDMVARVHTKYKIVDQKVRPVAKPLLADSIDRLKRVKHLNQCYEIRGRLVMCL